jgi:nucleoside-diphosphate-sugar epimerase
MLVALTGATGFLGRYVARHLVDQGHHLQCWYRPASDRSGFEAVANSVDWIPGSLGDEEAGDALLQGADAVVHAALEWPGPRHSRSRGPSDGSEFFDTNLVGTLKLFRAARARNIPRFIFISTCAVHDVILDDRPLDEAHPLWPKSHYGAHKAALEKFVHSYGFGEGWAICSLRPTGIYGLAHQPSQSRWFDLAGRVLRGEAIASQKGGKEVHALDVARAVGLLLNADPSVIAGQAYNCYDRYVSEQEVAHIARELSGSASSIEDLNRGPKHQIVTEKIRALGMTFGGLPLLRETVAGLIAAHRHGK